jgi:hypothetical protein
VTGEASSTASGISTISGTLANVTNNVEIVEYIVTPRSGTPGLCPGTPFKVLVTVNPAPRVEFSPAPQTICSGDQTQLVTLTSPTTGAVILWTAVQPVGITGVTTSGSGTIPVQTLTNTTIQPITVTYNAVVNIGTGANGCSGDTSRYTITVNPRIRIQDTERTICSGESFILTPLNTPPNQVVPIGTTYTWTVGVNPRITGQSNQPTPQPSISQILTNNTNVRDSLLYTVVASGSVSACGKDTFLVRVNVNPRPMIKDTAFTICGGSLFSYTPNNVGGNIVPSGTTYTWTVSANSNVTGQFNQMNNVSSINGGFLKNLSNVQQVLIYTVTPKSGSCTGSNFQIKITLIPNTVKFNLPNQTICSGQTTLPVTITPSSSTAVASWYANYPPGILGGINNGGGLIPSQTLINITTIPQEATYWAASFDQTGCGLSDTLIYIVTVNPRPIISQNGSVLISTVDQPKQWFLNGVALSGATQSAYTPVQSGSYTVKILSTGCESEPYNYVVTSVTQLQVNEVIRIAPNPVNQRAQIFYKLNATEESVTVRLLTALGRQVLEMSKVKNGAYISLEGLPPGIYFCLIDVGNGKRTFIQKLIKW